MPPPRIFAAADDAHALPLIADAIRYAIRVAAAYRLMPRVTMRRMLFATLFFFFADVLRAIRFSRKRHTFIYERHACFVYFAADDTRCRYYVTPLTPLAVSLPLRRMPLVMLLNITRAIDTPPTPLSDVIATTFC